MRLVFMGTPDFAVPCLEAVIAAGHDVVAVYSQQDKPVGRKQEILPTAVKACALEHGLPVYQPASLRNDGETERLRALAPECVVVVAYGKLIPSAMLAVPPKGFINVHGSLLPKYRGAAPIQWAVLNGDAESGVSTMLLDEGMDTGAILEVAKTPIGAQETSGELFDRLSALGAELLVSTLDKWSRGELQPTPQDESQATVAPMLSKDMARLDFSLNANTLVNRVRGFSPWPVAFTMLDGKRLKLYAASATKGFDAPVGTMRRVGDTLVVACGEQTGLQLLDLQLEGSRRMSAADFLNGRRVADTVFLGK